MVASKIKGRGEGEPGWRQKDVLVLRAAFDPFRHQGFSHSMLYCIAWSSSFSVIESLGENYQIELALFLVSLVLVRSGEETSSCPSRLSKY